MRIISGILKGKSINFLKNSNTRPLKDSVRESIFNVLKHSNLIDVKVEKSNILDLYSGVGSFGLEGISRGARRVYKPAFLANTRCCASSSADKYAYRNKGAPKICQIYRYRNERSLHGRS